MDSEVTFSNPSFQKNLWSLRNDFTDSTIICDGGTNRLGCHKIVLASVSQVLREKLKDSDEIDLGDVSNEDANLLIKFIYVGKIKVKEQDKEKIIELGQKYQIKGLQNSRVASSSSEISEDSDIENEVGKTIIDLPPEILMNILARLSTHDLLITVANVSKYFYHLTKDPGVHIKVSLPANIDQGPAVNFLKQMSKIRELKIFTYDDLELQLKPKPCSENPDQQLFCDELLIAVSRHSNLRVIDVSGLHATASTFNSLNATNFFTNLEQLSLHIEMTSGSFDRVHLELTIFDLSSIGKLKHIKLKGVSSVDPNLMTTLALSCTRLESFISDCQLSNAQQVSIYKERKATLKHLNVDSDSWDNEIFESLSQCEKIDKLTEYIYPFFPGINKLKNLRAIHLEFNISQSLEVVKKTFTESVLPQIESIGLTTTCNEQEIYPIIARGCPNVKVLYMCSSNDKVEMETFQTMIDQYDMLEIVITNLEFNNWKFNISELFVNANNKHKKLEYVGFDFGAAPRSQMHKLFRQIPSLICASYKRQLFVKSTETIESVLSFEKHFEFFNKIGFLKIRK